MPKLAAFSVLPEMVGAIGFEPTTYGTQNRRATKLRHAPTKRSLPRLAEREKVKNQSGQKEFF
jgi:hypothetical protein